MEERPMSSSLFFLLLLIPLICAGTLKSEKTTANDEEISAKDESLKFDLSAFSNEELVRLADMLQTELNKYEDSEETVQKLVAEPLVMIPSELVAKEPKKQLRSRRSKPQEKTVQILPVEVLERLTQPEPIIVLPEVDLHGPSYITVKEPSQENILSASEIDELELRERIARLADLLRERALRGL